MKTALAEELTIVQIVSFQMHHLAIVDIKVKQTRNFIIRTYL